MKNRRRKVRNGNILSGLPDAKKREAFRTLGRGRGFRVERIVSCGQATPKGQWLCSKRAEWVIVLKGRARLFFEGARKKLHMKTGDYVFIPAGTRHRVERTPDPEKTVWLAVHGNQ